jgi:hypothetical protein
MLLIRKTVGIGDKIPKLKELEIKKTVKIPRIGVFDGSESVVVTL